MWFNSIVSEEPYQGLKCTLTGDGNIALLTRTAYAGAAWLSSARALKCSLKWGNERNPYYALQVSRETAPAFVQEPNPNRWVHYGSWPEAGEEGGDDVKSAWPFDALGYTRVTMVGTMGCQTVRWS